MNVYFGGVEYVNSIVFSTGSCYSWTSPFLPKFQSSDLSLNPISRPITTSEAGLMVSIINLGLLVGPLFPALATEKLGKKTTLLLSAIPLLAAHVICFFSTTVNIFLVARFLMGFTTGAVWSVIPAYLGEICEPKNRGLLCSLITVMSCSGGLFCYATGPFLSMKWFSIVSLIPIVVFFIFVFFFIPESPYDLIMKNNFKKAEASLKKLRNNSDVYAELGVIKKSIEADKKNGGKFVDIFNSGSVLKAMGIGSVLMALSAMSGILAVLGYTQTIFDLAGTSIPSAYSAIIVGLIALCTAVLHAKLVDILGRKILITTACTMELLSLTLLGTFFYMQQNNFAVDSLEWLPLSSLVLCMSGFYFGLSSVPFIMSGELFPSHIKALATGLCSSVNFILNFFVTFCFPYLVESIGMAFTFWIFASFMAFGVIFCITLVPETKGKTLQEINVMFNKKG